VSENIKQSNYVQCQICTGISWNNSSWAHISRPLWSRHGSWPQDRAAEFPLSR